MATYFGQGPAWPGAWLGAGRAQVPLPGGRGVPVSQLQQPHTMSARGGTHLQVPVYQLVGLKVIIVFSEGVNDLLCNLGREGARGDRGAGTGTPSHRAFHPSVHP